MNRRGRAFEAGQQYPSFDAKHQMSAVSETARRNILILGSGRSGTSLLAGLFAKSGYFMGENLYPPRESNPKGFFEGPEINSINEEILSAVVRPRLKLRNHEFFRSRPMPGHRWLARVGLNPPLVSNSGIEERIRKIVSRTPYCIKDPRFSYTLPVWRPWLQDHVFLCIFRQPEVTAASMVKEVRVVREQQGYENYINFRQALSVWTCMYRQILEVHRREGDWLFVHYQQLLNGEALDKIERFTGASLDRSFPDSLYDRSRVNKKNFSLRPRRLYATLCSLAGYSASTPTAAPVQARDRPISRVAHAGVQEPTRFGSGMSRRQPTEAIQPRKWEGKVSFSSSDADHSQGKQKKVTKLSGIVLTRNGAGRLPHCLPELRQIVDELIVQIDDSTTDNSEEVARSYADRVISVPHRGPIENQLPEMVEACNGDWIFRLDDDEVLSGFSRDRLESILSCRRLTHVWVPRKWLVNQGREFISTAPWFPDFQMRIFRNLPSLISFPTRVHDPMSLAGMAAFLASESIDHMDLLWNDRARREAKVRTYQELQPERPGADIYFYEDFPHETIPVAPEPASGRGESRTKQHQFVNIVDCPRRMRSDLVYVARLKIHNAGDTFLLPANNLGESPTARICYHWFRESETGFETIVWEGLRCPLPVPLAPGDSADALVPVTPPPTPGRYVLQFDLVDDYLRKFWFTAVYPDSGWPTWAVDVGRL